jgi:hypothetical protein
MKKLIGLTLASGLTLLLTGCTSGNTPKKEKIAELTALQIQDKIEKVAVQADVREVCNIDKNGLKMVLNIAKIFNPIAVKGNYEFMRFHVKTSGYISAVEKALKSGSKTTYLIGKKKKIQKVDTKFAAQRACIFAIRAVQEHISSKSTWRMSIPGDGFKY